MTEASRHRTRLVGLGLSALFVVLAGKAGYLALSPDRESGHLVARAGEQVARADIVDRNGEQLATSVTVYSLVANPQLIWDPREVATRLAGVLPEIDVASLTERLSDQSREFVWVKRGLTQPVNDIFGSGDIGVSDAEADDVDTLGLFLCDLAADLDKKIGWHLVDATGESRIAVSSHPRHVPCARPRSRYDGPRHWVGTDVRLG